MVRAGMYQVTIFAQVLTQGGATAIFQMLTSVLIGDVRPLLQIGFPGLVETNFCKWNMDPTGVKVLGIVTFCILM